MRIGIAVAIMWLLGTSATAHDRHRLDALEQRIAALEEKTAHLESATAPAVAKASAVQRVDAQRRKARERMRKDTAIYSAEELREIESLYQVANKQWRSEEGEESLKKLIEKYDKANRTGCALLYLGQMSKGDERVEYLQQAIDGFSDCYYGDGVQVGAYARFYLAHHYRRNGDDRQADALFEELASEYPDAINHKGRLLSELMGSE